MHTYLVVANRVQGPDGRWTALDGRDLAHRSDQHRSRPARGGRERTPRLVKWAVHATRKPKQHEAPDTLYDRWRQEAAERGVDPDTLVRE